VLDSEGKLATAARIAVAAEVEVGISPGMELGGAAQSLSGAEVTGALPGVVDDDDGEAMTPLQLAQIGQQRGKLAAGVFVDAMQPYEGVEDEQARLQLGDGAYDRPRDRGAGSER
jgi:hypothetical protein